jgi:hypothetical protein
MQPKLQEQGKRSKIKQISMAARAQQAAKAPQAT